MRHSKEILIYLLFVGLSTLLWWVNAANKHWQHSSAMDTEKVESPIIPTEQLTDKKLNVAIEVLDIPQGKNIRIFPSAATIFLRVRVSDYSIITQEHVRVWCTYPTRPQEGLTLHTDIQDERILGVRVEPERVEYLIEN